MPTRSRASSSTACRFSCGQPFTTSFGTYETLDRPFVVIETSDGLRGVGEIPTLLDPAYKAEVDAQPC